MEKIPFLLILWSLLGLGEDSPYLLFANRRDLRLIDAQNAKANSTIIVSGLDDAAAVDFFYEENSVFWTDVSLEMIKRTYLNGSQISIDVITRGLVSPDGLACDWLGKKLYWTDSETNRIEVSNLDGSYRKVLFWEDLDQPRAIVLDPLNGYIYWTDWGETAKIERAGMDGTLNTRSVIVTEKIYWPNGLTLDYDDSKIYWADGKLAFIQSCDFDGKNRRTVIEGSLPHPFALTLYEDVLYWTDWESHSINSCNKVTGGDRKTIHSDIFSPMDIHVFTPRRQPKGVNPCEAEKAGCSHLCLMSPIRPYYKCACPTGVKLLEDGKTCANGPEEILLLARRPDIRRISLDTPDYTDVILPLDNIKHAIAIDYDPVEGYVYWTDDEVMVIKRSLLDGTNQELLISTEVKHPDGIAVDWIARNFYWTDTGNDRIEVARLNGTLRKIIISEDLHEPRAICVDPIDGYMYWTDWGESPRIERANLDGSERKVLINSSLGWPNGIAIDHNESKIYWGDAHTDQIEVANSDGTGRRFLVTTQLYHVFGFSLLGDYIYWTDWQIRSIERVNKRTGKNREVIIHHLPDLMGLKATYYNRTEGTNPCADNNFGCSHLCLMRAKKLPVCVCPVGLELQKDGKTCIVPEAFLLFSCQDDIRRISLETAHNQETIPIQGVKKAMAIDFDINDNRIYWTDGEEKSISRAFMNGSALEHIVQFGLDKPEGMAVDWVAHNIHWIDSGTKRIEVARLDGMSRRVLIWKDLEDPRTLALDPANGHMYWSEWSTSKPRIERSSLDGSQREVFIQDVGRVYGLTLDYGDKRLFWTDFDSHYIESCDLTGNDRRKIITGDLPQPIALTQYQDYIFWTDWERQMIERANKSNGLNRTTVQAQVSAVVDILVFHGSRQSGFNGCSNNNGDGTNNGGCSHLCLVKAKKSGNTTHYCACPSQYKLSADNKTCISPQSFILSSQRTQVKRFVVDTDEDDLVNSPEIVLPIPTLRNIKGINYDPVDQYVYWIDGRNKIIKRARDNGSDVSVVVTNPGEDLQPFSIALDPFSRKLYWSCTQKNVINVTKLDGKPVGIIIGPTKDQEEKPKSIALNPLKGHLYFTNMVNPPKIERAAMDGTERTVLFDTDLGHPTALTIDQKAGKIYWADSVLKRIECSDLDGAKRKVLVKSDIGTPRGLTIFGQYLYWVDKEQQQIKRTDKSTGRSTLTIRKRVSGLSDIHAVQAIERRQYSRHPCSEGRHECTHLCIASDAEKSRCSCPLGLVLKPPHFIECANPPVCTPEQFRCKSGDMLCIPIMWRCDGQPECVDSSDEEGCPKCTSSQFKCDIGKCIPSSQVCDGIAQCDDKTDEYCCKSNEKSCDNNECVSASLWCNGEDDCSDKSDEFTCVGNAPQKGPGNQTHTTHYTVAIVISLISLVLIFTVVFVCRKKTQQMGYDDRELMVITKPLNPQSENSTPPTTLSSQGKSGTTTLKFGSGSGPPLYDRTHITGKSSSSSTVTHYPKETLNPPPSPATDRSVFNGELYYTPSNSPSTVRSYRPYRMRNIPPHPTPCSTDVCEESEPYPSSKKYKYYCNNSVAELNYDSDPYPPPPTPRSHYLSDEQSCPPSPSTERSFFNPYPPPPSPVGNSDC